MLTRLVICLCIGSIIHAESIISTSTSTSVATPSPAPFVIDDELAKLSTGCITPEEHETLLDHIVRWRASIFFNIALIQQANAMIGLEELRAALGFGPRGNTTKYNNSDNPPPSAEELEAAPTLEAYYQLREPAREIAFDSEWFYEYNFPPAIAFMDKRFPTIRKIFRHKFDEVLRGYAEKDIDRKAVDHMIEEFQNIRYRIHDKMKDLNIRTMECEHAEREHIKGDEPK